MNATPPTWTGPTASLAPSSRTAATARPPPSLTSWTTITDREAESGGIGRGLVTGGGCWAQRRDSAADPVVALRDSKNPAGSVLAIPPLAWTAFTTTLRAGTLG
ncbi:MAG: DUF397 domain-containing protein [Pseudonocardiaceae bacterium]